MALSSNWDARITPPMTAHSLVASPLPPSHATPGVKPWVREEVDAFLNYQKVAPDVDKMLRDAPREVQMAVIYDGPLVGEGDPTAILLGRLSEANKKFQAAESSRQILNVDVEQYLAEAPVEPYAANRLRGLPPPQQQQVMQKSLKRARDPSRLLLGIINDVTRHTSEYARLDAAEGSVPQHLQKVVDKNRPLRAASRQCANSGGDPEEEDEMDAVLRQLQQEEKDSKNKKKRPDKTDSADAPNAKKIGVVDFRNPQARGGVNPMERRKNAPVPEVATPVPACRPPGQAAWLNGAVDEAFAQLRSNTAQLTSKIDRKVADPGDDTMASI